MQAICGKVIRQLWTYLFLDFSKTKVIASVTQKQYVKLGIPKMYPHTKFWISTSHYIQILSRLDLSRNVARGQGHKQENSRWHTVANRFIHISNCEFYAQYTIFIQLRLEFKVRVSQKEYAIISNIKMHPHTKFEIVIWNAFTAF